MLSSKAVVVVKRGDDALTQYIADGVITKAATPEEFREFERNYDMMCTAYRNKLANAMAESKTKYDRKKRWNPKFLLYLQIGYAMIACLIVYIRDSIIISRRKQRH